MKEAIRLGVCFRSNPTTQQSLSDSVSLTTSRHDVAISPT